MNDLTDIISQFTFVDLLLLTSIGFLVLIAIFSLIRYIKFEERIALLFRHIAGFIVGLIDQTFMVIFNFQPAFLGIVVLFDYAAYCTWFLLMPTLTKYEKARVYIVLWILVSAAMNTIFEHASLITLTGGLHYPTEPIVWTSIHTVIFYLGMHTIGTLIVIAGFRLNNKK